MTDDLHPGRPNQDDRTAGAKAGERKTRTMHVSNRPEATVSAPIRLRRFASGPQRYGLFVKAALLFAGIAVLVAIEIALAIWVFRGTEQDLHQVHEVDDEKVHLISLMTQSRDLLAGLKSASPPDVRHYTERWNSTLTLARTNMVEIGTDRHLILGAEIDVALLDLARHTGESAIAVDARSDLERLLPDMQNVLLSRVQHLQDAHLATMHESTHRRQTYLLWLSLLWVAGFIGGAAIAGRFILVLVQSLEQLKERTARIAAGDYSGSFDVRRRDEIGQVMRAVNELARGLEKRDRELEAMHLRMAQQEKIFALGTLAARITHEIGNPLQAIMALSLHVSSDLRDKDQAGTMEDDIAHLETIADTAERISRTINEIREFVRPDGSDRSAADVNEIVGNTLRLMRFEPRLRSVGLHTALTGQACAVEAVPDHIVQVLVNLLINAADAVAERDDGQITVLTRREADEVVIEVSDNGSGMSDEIKRRAFEAFYTSKAKGKGTGLGLSICQTIIRDHGGRIDIDSTPGEGTTVRVRLPGVLPS